MARQLSESIFSELLERAVYEPGVVSRAYTEFYGYSLRNQLLAMYQCLERGITPGPIATFKGWIDKGRWVRKGERAIILCMPVMCQRRPKNTTPDEEDTDRAEPETFIRFVFRPNGLW